MKLTLTDAHGKATERQIMGYDTRMGADGAWYYLLYVMVDGNKVELARSRQQGSSPLTPFVEDLVRAYQEAGYLLQGEPVAGRNRLAFGVCNTTHTAVLTASAEARRRADQWTTCILTQQVQWQLRKPYGLIDECIAREYA